MQVQDKRLLIQGISKLRFTMLMMFWRDSAEHGVLPNKEDSAIYDLLGALQRQVEAKR